MRDPNDAMGAFEPPPQIRSVFPPDHVLRSLAAVRSGEIINLDFPVDAPPLLGDLPDGRPGLRHHPRMHNEIRPRQADSAVVVNDDVLEFCPQGSSHWDALAHWGAVEEGDPSVFARGRGWEETSPSFGAKTLGIDLLAGGVITRGVLLDMVGLLPGTQRGFVPDEHAVIGGDDVLRALERQGVDLRAGDAVLIYTGFTERRRSGCYFRWIDGELVERAAGLGSDSLPLFVQAEVFALISDNPSVESTPMGDGVFHTRALKHHGIHLGELWNLDGLIDRCRSQGQWDFLLVSSPLYVRGAFGSPANAFAVL